MTKATETMLSSDPAGGYGWGAVGAGGRFLETAVAPLADESEVEALAREGGDPDGEGGGAGGVEGVEVTEMAGIWRAAGDF